MWWIEVNGGSSSEALNINAKLLVVAALLVTVFLGSCFLRLTKSSSIASPRALGAVKTSPTYGSKVEAAKVKTGSRWASAGMVVLCWPRPTRAAANNKLTDKVDLNASRKKVRRESGI